MATTKATRKRVAAVVFDDLGDLVEDWEIILKARNRTPATILSYQTVERAFVAYLDARGISRSAAAITREHVEAYLADLQGNLKPATVAKQYRSLQQLFRWLVEGAQSRCRRWRICTRRPCPSTRADFE